jgi:shikimate dehydrogenase
MQDISDINRKPLRLGLIGGNIRHSRAPYLHKLCGRLAGLQVTYDLLVPAEIGDDFEAVFEQCRRSGMRGVNITYPYKERVVPMVHIEDDDVARIGSVNTVVFEETGPEGFNTDYSGFMAAYVAMFGNASPGVTALVGTGGVGRAIAFGLLALGASELRLIDRERSRARLLARELEIAASGSMAVTVFDEVTAAIPGTDGIINATPMGMIGYSGSAIPVALLGEQSWIFDAVYTPVETEFVKAARAVGLSILSGYELFFYQGVHAFELFTGTRPNNLGELRRLLNNFKSDDK